jgi:ADP-ribose pyrophosphatase YjhB (NUDIX family)
MTCSAVVALCCAVLQLPAGVIEKGESVEELAVRELKEETGGWEGV